MTDRLLRLIVLLIAVLAHVVAYLQYRYQLAPFLLTEPERWLVIGMMLGSLMITVIMPFHRRSGFFWVLVTLRAFILIIIGHLVRDYFGVELTLLAALLIETITYSRFIHGVIAAGVLILSVFLMQTQFLSSFIKIPFFSPYDHITFITYSCVIAAITILLRYQRENQISIRELNERLHEATLALAQTNMKLQEYAISAEQDAMLAERKRVAREVHDTLAYTLTNLVMMMEAALDLANQGSDRLPQYLEAARDQAKEGLAEVRRALNAMRPVQLTDLNGLAAVYRLVKAFEQASQIKVDLEMGDAPLFFGSEGNLAVFRLVQEGLTNALRHGRATRIEVTFSREKGGLSITIRDNGIGCDESENNPKSGYGLLGMEERISRLGGRLTTKSLPGQGFTLTAWIPLTEE